MKELIKLAIEQSKEAVVIFSNHLDHSDIQPKIVYANQQFVDDIGMEIEHIIGLNPVSFLCDPLNDEELTEIKETIMSGNIWEGPLRLCDVNHKSKVVYIKILPICNLDNDVIYYACFGSLIEERQHDICKLENCKHLENFVTNLFDQSNYYKDLTEKLNSAIWRTDNLGNIVYSNSVSKDLFKLKPGVNIFDKIFKADQDEVKKVFKKNYKSSIIIEETIRLKVGRGTKWVKSKIWPVFHEDIVIGFSGAMKDVTTEQMLIKDLEMLRNK